MSGAKISKPGVDVQALPEELRRASDHWKDTVALTRTMRNAAYILELQADCISILRMFVRDTDGSISDMEYIRLARNLRGAARSKLADLERAS